jgi:hypothetical protein
MPKRLAMTILCAPQYIDESAGTLTRRAGMAKSKWIKAFDGGDRDAGDKAIKDDLKKNYAG